jgi:hypothetical protein
MSQKSLRVQNPKLLEMEQICRRVDLTNNKKKARARERERERICNGAPQQR